MQDSNLRPSQCKWGALPTELISRAFCRFSKYSIDCSNMEIQILYEDADILAVNKPAGLVVHPDGKTKELALTDWVLDKYPQTKEVGEPIATTKDGIIERPGIVHRLDRETSGVLLIAKTKEGHACLKKQFQEHKISKKYIAFVYGDLKEPYGIIDRPIGRSPSDFRQWSATRGARGEMREAETWWTCIAHGREYSLVEIEPKTGRTHQIRVHFKAINHPVVCDSLYASDKPCLFGFDRTALHASSIIFENCDGKKIQAQAPLPADFKQAIKDLNIQKVAENKGIC